MGTREIIDGLPEKVRAQVEQYRADYTRWMKYANGDDEGYANTGRRCAEEVRQRMGGYSLGLFHAGLLDDRGR